jgi:hypothetical protein
METSSDQALSSSQNIFLFCLHPLVTSLPKIIYGSAYWHLKPFLVSYSTLFKGFFPRVVWWFHLQCELIVGNIVAM